MSTFIRWIILTLLGISFVLILALAVSRHFIADSTVAFWAANGRGTYNYLYDSRSGWLYLNETWPLGSQIAPNGEFGLIINRGNGTTLIDYVSADGLRERLGEFSFNPTDVIAYWSSDSGTIYLHGREDNVITIYGIEIASLKLSVVAEFDVLDSQRFFFYYYPEQGLFTLSYTNVPANDYTLIYVYELDSQKKWAIEGYEVFPHGNGSAYLIMNSSESSGEDATLTYISIRNNIEKSMAVPPEGDIVHINLLYDDRQAIVTTISPNKSYVLDLESGHYLEIADEALISFFALGSQDIFVLDYHAAINGSADRTVWYQLDLETYEFKPILEPNWTKVHVAVFQDSLTLSSDNQNLAMIISKPDRSLSIAFISMETGELIHEFEVPEGLNLANPRNSHYILEWLGT